MASKGAKAALMDTSVKRLQAAIDRVAESTGLEPLKLPTHDRDPEMLMAFQVEAMANFMESLADSSKPTRKSPVTEADAADMPDAKTEDVDSARKIDKPTVSKSTKEKR